MFRLLCSLNAFDKNPDKLVCFPNQTFDLGLALYQRHTTN